MCTIVRYLIKISTILCKTVTIPPVLNSFDTICLIPYRENLNKTRIECGYCENDGLWVEHYIMIILDIYLIKGEMD